METKTADWPAAKLGSLDDWKCEQEVDGWRIVAVEEVREGGFVFMRYTLSR